MYRMKNLAIALLLGGLLTLPPAAGAETVMDPELRAQARQAVDKGLRFLRESQADSGALADSVGVTALGLRAFLESYRGYDESDGAFITRPLAFLLAHVNADGSISETNQNRAYNTAVSLVALAATGNERYAAVIQGGQAYLKSLQLGPEEGYEPDHRYYGGIGYGGDLRPDLSNQYMAMEALRATALDPEDPTWERALAFISRSQNLAKTNDQSWAGEDGGFTYMPGYSPHGGTDSYGAMTHAGLLSLLFAGVDRNDPRVQAAWDWIRSNYTLDDNPGAKDRSGLFYYYNAFAKSMYTMGAVEVEDAAGKAHNWRNDLAAKLVGLQKDDGSWENPWSQRWWEGKAQLVTAWSVIALNYALREPRES
jgi:squalene-hopene/tetraprenyl-beta-curcumene cyclase